MPPTQQSRFLAIETKLGKDKVLLKNFSMNEQLGRLFQMEVELRSEDRAIQFENIVGTSATVKLKMPNGQTRCFNGVVSRFVQVEHQGSYAVYRATLVPWFWLLTRTADCRIFQNKSVPDIIEQVFKAQGFNDYKLKLSGSYRPWVYCVQYRETDFNFTSRLMEQEGIYYFFEHQDGKHTLVLADSPSAHEPFAGYDTLVYRPPTTRQEENKETVTDWVMEKEIQPGMYAVSAFNFTTPKAAVQGNDSVSRQYQGADYEVFDYPGDFGTRAEGEGYAKLRIQELQAQYEILRAQATVRGVASGYKFTLKSHPRSDQNRPYLITGASLQAKAGEYESRTADQGDFYFCSFTAIPASEPFRAPRTTPKPLIRGPQTAIVVGPSGQKIYTDPNGYGMVKVHFHWDRHDKQDENSSCWVRVSQAWASKNWGDMAVPHVGDEVIVECLEGDPDRPIITGRVYNASNMPPLDLPANKDKSIIRDHYGNEIILDATSGNEHIRLHSPHHNSFFDLGQSVNSFSNSNKQTLQIGNYYNVTGGFSSTVVGGVNAQATGGVSVALNLGMIYNLAIGGNHNFTLGYQFSYSAGPSSSICGGDINSISDSNNIVSAGKTLCLVGGNNVVRGGSTQAGNIDNTSIINASEASLIMSVGEKMHVDDSMSLGAKIALVLSFVFAAGGSAAAIISLMEASNSANYDSANDSNYPWYPAGVSMACGVASLIAGIVFAQKIKKGIDVSTIQHNAPKGSIKLDGQTGAITIESKDAILIQTTENGGIEINSKKGLKLTCQADLELYAAGQVKLKGQNIAMNGPMNLANGAIEVHSPPPSRPPPPTPSPPPSPPPSKPPTKPPRPPKFPTKPPP